MLKAYRHLYKRHEFEMLDPQGKPIKSVHYSLELKGKPWYDYLTPRHRAFYDSLTPIIQMMLALHGDPFHALKNQYMEMKKL